MPKQEMDRQADTLDVNSGTEAIFGLLSDDLDLGVEQIEEGEGEDNSADDAELEDVEVEDSDEDEDEAEEADSDGDEDDDDDDTLEDEVEEEDDEATDEDAPQTFKVKVDGDEIEVTLDEALKGYQRQQAFTRKTQALAEERQTLTAEAQAAVQARQELLDQLDIVEQALTGGDTEPNWTQVKKDNPKQYAEIRAAWEERQEQVSSLRTRQQELREQQKQALETERNRVLSVEAERLEAAIPEWAADQDVARTEKQKIVQFAENTYGFTPDDLGSVVDHRVILLLRDAMKYNDLQSQGDDRKKLLKKTRRKSPTLQPGSPSSKSKKKQSKANSARKRLAQTGRISDAESAFLEMLDD